MASVHLDALRRVFPDGTVGLHGLNLDIADGEFLTFLGPSGSGKTTTLRMIAGLEHPQSGSIHFGARRVDQLAPAARNVAMVFQNYALYPNMTVRGNLEYPLRKRRVAGAERARRVEVVAALLQIEPLLARRPRQLSGGQQQRVALGRAMVRDSDVFLLDEPLSNLDAELRTHMRAELIQLHRRLGRTMIYVTHDQMEAMTMSTRIAVLARGHLQQVAPPAEIYAAPANLFVAGFVGAPAMNLLPGRLERDGRAVRFVGEHLAMALSREVTTSSEHVVAGIRPEHLTLRQGGDQARILVVERAGHETLAWFTLGERRMVARLPAASALEPGDGVSPQLDPAMLHLFDAESGARCIGACETRREREPAI